MKKLGKDLLNNNKVIIATNRNKRPFDKNNKKEYNQNFESKEYDKKCPFCRGNEQNIVDEMFSINKNNKWIVKSVKNKYPIIDNNPKNKIKGEHEVIIDTYKHNTNFFNMTEEEFYYVLLMYKNRFEYLKNNKNSQYISLFKNHLRNAGASLMHAHSQILSLPFIPPTLKEEYDVCEKFYKEKGVSFYKTIINKEISYKKRIIYNNDDFLVFIPKTCRFTGDTVILFKKNIYFNEIEDDKIKELAKILKKLFGKMYNEYGNCPFNLYLHSHPVNVDNDYKDIYNVHIHIIPRKFNFGGFELSTGMYISSTKSEDIAQKLKFD